MMSTASSAADSRNCTLSGQASLSDHDRENLIELWRLLLVHDPDQDVKQFAAARMRSLIAQRSPQRVREMESAKGLR